MSQIYRVTQESNASDINGGGPRFGASGAPVDSSDDCTVNAGSLDVIVNNEGSWSDVQANDWLTWDTGGAKEHRKVQSVNGANITLTSAVSGAAANKKVRIGGAWNTLGQAANTVAAGDTVYVKGGTSYTTQHGSTGAIMEIQTAGDHDDVITIEGYTLTPGDRGTAVIDGQESLKCITTSLGNTYHNYIFRNLQCTQSSDHGFDLQASAIQFYNCEADHSVAYGFNAWGYSQIIGCSSHDNGTYGIRVQAGSVVCDSMIYDNGGYGIYGQYSELILGNVITGNAGQVQVYVLQQPCVVMGNTIDGYNSGYTPGIVILSSGTYAHQILMANNIITRCSNGISGPVTEPNMLAFHRNNLFYNNVSNYSLWNYTDGDITGQDPLFMDASSDDYRLKLKSPAIRAGWPEFLDIGALQAGRLPVGNLTNRGVQR